MPIEYFRSVISNILGNSTAETTPPMETGKCIVYQTPQGTHAFSAYQTDLDSERVSKELTGAGNAIIGSYTITEARDLLNRTRIAEYNNK